MKHFPFILLAAAALFFTSCNNQSSKTGNTASAPAPASMAPYTGVFVTHGVADYDKWYQDFKAGDSARTAAGLTQPAVGRGLDDDKQVVVALMASDITKAKAFCTDPHLAEVMKTAGVTGAPTITYQNVLFDDTSSIPQHERLMVVHHVKDFDAWKKAFDGEGAAARASNGLVERLLARSIDDPNTVTLLFAITDMAKAKARVGSPELKKIMTDAGVDSDPQITWFKWVAM